MDVKFFQTDSENLATLPIRAGQLIYLDDINALFWDKSDTVREEMTDVVILEDNTQRIALTNPTAKLYLVQKPSPALWRYQEGEWRSVSSDLVYYGTTPPESEGVTMWIDPGEEPEYLSLDDELRKKSLWEYPILHTYTPEGGVEDIDFAADMPNGTEPYEGFTITIIPHRHARANTAIMLNGSPIVSIPYDSAMPSTFCPASGAVHASLPVTLRYSAYLGMWITVDIPLIVNIPTTLGGTGRGEVPRGYYLVGDATNSMLVKSPDEVREHIGALPAQTGRSGQVLGFTADDVVGAVDPPGASWTVYSGDYIGELDIISKDTDEAVPFVFYPQQTETSVMLPTNTSSVLLRANSMSTINRMCSLYMNNAVVDTQVFPAEFTISVNTRKPVIAELRTHPEGCGEDETLYDDNVKSCTLTLNNPGTELEYVQVYSNYSVDLPPAIHPNGEQITRTAADVEKYVDAYGLAEKMGFADDPATNVTAKGQYLNKFFTDGHGNPIARLVYNAALTEMEAEESYMNTLAKALRSSSKIYTYDDKGQQVRGTSFQYRVASPTKNTGFLATAAPIDNNPAPVDRYPTYENWPVYYLYFDVVAPDGTTEYYMVELRRYEETKRNIYYTAWEKNESLGIDSGEGYAIWAYADTTDVEGMPPNATAVYREVTVNGTKHTVFMTDDGKLVAARNDATVALIGQTLLSGTYQVLEVNDAGEVVGSDWTSYAGRLAPVPEIYQTDRTTGAIVRDNDGRLMPTTFYAEIGYHATTAQVTIQSEYIYSGIGIGSKSNNLVYEQGSKTLRLSGLPVGSNVQVFFNIRSHNEHMAGGRGTDYTLWLTRSQQTNDSNA